jgi:hypothetical protein
MNAKRKSIALLAMQSLPKLSAALKRIEPLPALGALLVLATFVVKDGFREHYKDIAATADTARSCISRTISSAISP